MPYFNNEAALDSDLLDPASEICRKVAKLLPLAQQYAGVTVIEPKSLLQKTDFDPLTGDVWFKDGVCFAHTNKHYEVGDLNPLMLEWKTPETSFYTNLGFNNQQISVNLKFND